ncbi:hypothetical protein [Carboxylicivirga sp. M1479]|uniref:hypothetical protein n=1 Tax=Carboxylicivirga sp. M1479 TaxID=2594476 RepID=UPI0011781972|nr:hypothetical protein [Carboxylicivirga sp. M1479]TRX65894.1 hypothetical protein FNN09_16530 [Carboxylicivirga sp. M1479]
MNRINVLNESKFDRLTNDELRSTKGGLCISCKKRDRKVEIGLKNEVKYESSSNAWTYTGTLTF